MRVFTFISEYGKLLPLAMKVRSEGHRVLFYINNPSFKEVGNGLVERHPAKFLDEEEFKHPATDCFIVEGENLGLFTDRLRKSYPTLGPTAQGDVIHRNEDYRKSVFKVLSINTGRARGFKVYIEAWISLDVVLVTYTILDEELMEGAIGPSLGVMGTTIVLGSTEDRLFKDTLGRYVQSLIRVGFRGPASLEATVSEDGLILGQNMLLGMATDSLPVVFELIKGNVNDFLYSIASGTCRQVATRGEVGLGVYLKLIPGLQEGTYVDGVNESNANHVWLVDVVKEGNRLKFANTSGELGIITSRGESLNGYSPVRESRRRAFRTIKHLDINKVIYRRDIGEKAFSILPMIKTICS